MTGAPTDIPSKERFYYLVNFLIVVDSVLHRYAGLLSLSEREFIANFHALPRPSQALMVRMVMRSRTMFRATDLCYPEIGDIGSALAPLIELGWVDAHPQISIEELFRLLKKAELLHLATLPANPHITKSALLRQCAAAHPDARPIEEWCAGLNERIYQLLAAVRCERLRVMYFGNFRQSWSEFVLAELGIYHYEITESSEMSRPFQTVLQLEQLHRIHHCRQMLASGTPLDEIVAEVPGPIDDSDWLESRRHKLLFRLGQAFERAQNTAAALDIYAQCCYREAKERVARIQRVRSGCPRPRPAQSPVPVFELCLARPGVPFSVERIVMDELARESPGTSSIHYVENLLINSLFGLLCWRAIFAPIPGAFFHAFHREPVDLAEADFYQRRRHDFADCFAEFDRGTYKQTIRKTFTEKAGRASPFVAWRALSEALLELALACLPAEHLRRWFRRIAEDVPANRAGVPDLIQFWPQDSRYRMIEVKAPGDRLQANQRRYLDFCVLNCMPVSVCNVRWRDP